MERKANVASSRLNYIICFSLPILLLAGVLAAPKGEFWETKDYREWTQKECAKMLEDSPWAKQLKWQKTMQSDKDDAATLGGDSPYINYQAQLNTALPIRQAIIRQQQLANKYDSLSAEQKQQFDKNADTYLSAIPGDTIIVKINYSTNNSNYDQDLARNWQSKTTELLQNSVFLIPSKGAKVRLARFAVAQGSLREFQFAFPRQVDGKDVIGPEDKSFKLQFPCPIVSGLGDGNGYYDFKLEKMQMQGKIVF
jgi:hypothetical protein